MNELEPALDELLQRGFQVTWLSRHLGHSSLKVTTDIYGL